MPKNDPSVRVAFELDGATCRTHWFTNALAAKEWADSADIGSYWLEGVDDA